VELIGKLLSSDVVLLALVGTLGLWSIALLVVWQEKRKKTA